MSALDAESTAQVDKRAEQARWYAYGRQDEAGPSAIDTGVAEEFVRHYRRMADRWMRGEVGVMQNLRDAYRDWHAERFPTS